MVSYYDCRFVDCYFDDSTVSYTSSGIHYCGSNYADITDEIEPTPWRQVFFKWLRTIYTAVFPKRELKNKTVMTCKKVYNKRLLFCESGYLPVRLREKKFS